MIGEGGCRRDDQDLADINLVRMMRGLLATENLTDWRIAEKGLWCYFTPPQVARKIQGWKLHLSATPLSAPIVLARAAPILVSRNIPFKFARTLADIEHLGSRQIDRGAGGKFITIYPAMDDERLIDLAKTLDIATQGIPGPRILSDREFRPGSLVHYRYGVHAGLMTLSNDGAQEAMLLAPDGSLELDHRDSHFAAPAWAPPDPFTAEYESEAVEFPSGGTVPIVLNNRYVIDGAIKHTFAGSVYLATDQDTRNSVIVKQGRAHAESNVTGRDSRDSIRHEASMLTELGSSSFTPKLIDLFEQQGDVFLVEEKIEGVPLRRWVRNNVKYDGENWEFPVEAIFDIALELTNIMRGVHDRGYVVRDFNPNNIIIDEQAKVWLIDLECLTTPGALVSRLETKAYASPEQSSAARLAPAFGKSSDFYSLGATFFYLLSGVDPLLIADSDDLPRPTNERLVRWLSMIDVTKHEFSNIIEAVNQLCVDSPEHRADLNHIAALVTKTPDRTQISSYSSSRSAEGLLADGLGYLLRTRNQSGERLWPLDRSTSPDPLNVQNGAAGVLGFLTRLQETCDDSGQELFDAISQAANWIVSRLEADTRILPGLYFGRSGTAWSLLMAGHSLGDARLVDIACNLAHRIPMKAKNPDVCHGLAGAGLAQLHFWEVTNNEEYLHRVVEAADAIVASAVSVKGELLWPIPPDPASLMSGLTHYGYAHGTAGIGMFLLAAANATGNSTYHDLALSAANTLANAADIDRGAAYWTRGPGETVKMTHWCSGSSGIATFLLRVWSQTKDPRLAELCNQSAMSIRRGRWHSGTAQCHGLSGDGEFLLDASAAFNDSLYTNWAHDLLNSLRIRLTRQHGFSVFPDDTGFALSAGFNTGMSGILSFIGRLLNGGDRLWLPSSLSL
nr:class IV lanthionine synthetase LanL [Streptomyces chartreusis]